MCVNCVIYNLLMILCNDSFKRSNFIGSCACTIRVCITGGRHTTISLLMVVYVFKHAQILNLKVRNISSEVSELRDSNAFQCFL
jgi:hypothetical protein